MKAKCIASALLIALCSLGTDASFAQSSATDLQAPGADVPAGCAAFSGAWSGEWPRAGLLYLWVMSVAPDCSAQVVYGKTAKPSPADKLSAATIKGETLTLPRPDGGTTIFDLKDNVLTGRYRGPSGFNQGTMERIALDTATRLGAEQRARSAMIPLASDVPAECAAFYGQWAGTWSQGRIAQQFLRVVELKAAGGKCSARYSYSSSETPVAASDTTEVNGGTLAFICNSSTGGTCVFKRSGDELWASYSNPSGGSNSAVFKKVQ